MPKTLYKVTCKAALFNLDRSKVLLTEYRENDFGLPGGHLEEGETPNEAVIRELHEELGINSDGLQLQRKDFWMHPNGKVILGFTGVLDENTRLVTENGEGRAAHWISISDIQQEIVSAGTYNDFILRNSVTP